MATAAPASAEKKPLPGKKADGEPRPPSDSVWLRYSKHGEFPLSTTASFAIHALVIGLLIVLGLFVFGKRKENTPPVDVVRYNIGKGQGRGQGPATASARASTPKAAPDMATAVSIRVPPTKVRCAWTSARYPTTFATIQTRHEPFAAAIRTWPSGRR